MTVQHPLVFVLYLKFLPQHYYISGTKYTTYTHNTLFPKTYANHNVLQPNMFPIPTVPILRLYFKQYHEPKQPNY